MGRYKTKTQSVTEANQRILNEQEGLPGKTIFQIKFSEEWGKGVDNKGELFFVKEGHIIYCCKASIMLI